MTFLNRIVFIIILLLNVAGVIAQQASNSIDEVYGSDPLLYNGKFYIFFPPLNTGGNQYFSSRQFEFGSAEIRGVTYSKLVLNYDIYNQQLILQYKNYVGSTNLIIIPDAWLESFSFKGLTFKIVSSQDTLKRIFQVLGTGPDHLLYHWTKKLNLDSFLGAKNFTFSVAKKEMNLFNGNRILKFWNNKSFYSLFDTEKQIKIKGYIRKSGINVKKSTDDTMTELINYCNSLYPK